MFDVFCRFNSPVYRQRQFIRFQKQFFNMSLKHGANMEWLLQSTIENRSYALYR